MTENDLNGPDPFFEEDLGEGEDTYVLTAPRYRHVEKFMTPKGDILHNTKRFRRGDSIDELDKDEIDRLVGLGCADSVANIEEAKAIAEAEAIAAEDAVEADDEAVTGEAEQVEPPTEPQGTGEPQGDGTEPQGDGTESASEPVDYSGWEYSDLQKAAKERTGNGGGSKDELIERLAAQDLFDSEATE